MGVTGAAIGNAVVVALVALVPSYAMRPGNMPQLVDVNKFIGARVVNHLFATVLLISVTVLSLVWKSKGDSG